MAIIGKLAEILGIKLIELREEKPAQVEEIIWATVLVIAFLEKEFQETKEEWEFFL